MVEPEPDVRVKVNPGFQLRIVNPIQLEEDEEAIRKSLPLSLTTLNLLQIMMLKSMLHSSTRPTPNTPSIVKSRF